ncbi:transcriptional regulator [Sinorhizobium sp. 8-89]|uniref:transcriptional regulator n=1 Tax=Sinorhizobium sp. 7-81 TaxID=3049087 RepID=UPI0024C3F743|nr:transcriptional regulator [Sinorhizobium sp. 7-81]MDK1387705.1 transcriptional regulator [Sinorhizobium sp. 7-81]
MLADRSIVVVAPDQGLRRSLAFALEVEGYSAESYDALWKAEGSSRASLCTIVDDEILKSEAQAAQALQRLGGRVILLVDGMSPLQEHDGTIILTKPISGSDLLGVVNSLAAIAK